MANIYNNIPDMVKNEFEKPEQPDYQGVVSSLNKEHNLSDDKGFKLAKTDDPAYKGVNILHPTGRGMTPNELEWAMKNKSLKDYQENANAREEAMRKSLGETDKPQPQYDFDINDEDSIFDAWEQGKIDEKTRDRLNSERQRRLVGHDFDIGYSKYPIGEDKPQVDKNALKQELNQLYDQMYNDPSGKQVKRINEIKNILGDDAYEKPQEEELSPYEKKYGKLSDKTKRLIELGEIQDPRLSYKENENELMSEEDNIISTWIDDYSWSITPRDTVDSYSKLISSKAGVPQDKVLAIMERELGKKLSLSDNMARVMGMLDEEDNVENKPQDKIQKITENAINEFGITNDFSKGFYMLPDGRMLDGTYKGSTRNRSVDHRDIGSSYNNAGVELDDDSSSATMLDFMRNGNIRMKPESHTIDMSVKPTDTQLNQIYRMFNLGKLDNIEITNPNDKYGQSVGYLDNIKNERQIADFIKRYFK